MKKEKRIKAYTSSYYYTRAGEKIKNGSKLYFGNIWNGDGDGRDILNSEAYVTWETNKEEAAVVEFTILDACEDEMRTFIKVTDIRNY